LTYLIFFQTKQLEKAASAAFTFLVAHPDNKVMSTNLKHYLDHNVEKKDIVNYEAKDYVYLYAHGADAYEKKKWQFVVFNMEESLVHYLQAEEECRAQCEGPFDHGWYPDFIPSISNHFTVALRCKQKCRKKLSSLNGEIHDDLLPSHYHYLQYAYYKLGNLKAACQAVASYLLFYPDDETMLDNMRYYSKQPKVDITYFQPRREATQYMQRQIYETRILKFVHNEFKNKLVTATTEGVPSQTDSTTSPSNSSEMKLKSGVTMNESDLKGAKRVVIDGMTTPKECKSLMEIAKYYAVIGDGYEGKSPHTKLEKFEGITFNRALFLSYYKMLNLKHLHTFFEVTEKAKELIKVHFKLKGELYFSYTQLVCRSARPDSPTNRTDFSHKIHADNCIIMENMTCFRTYPAFTWRDYSAILYLNDDFKGGEFVFSADAVGKKIQSKIRPKCGRLVAFSSGPENLHGVKAVKRGTRCAIGMWFTLNPDYVEKHRDFAKTVVDNNSQFEMDWLVNLDYPKPYVPIT
uniref:procollagen-proline 3-dioxygenase n=1 Tax=Diabrotica virgifera virgifera TaxID=50390 RepID=A0A6P7GKK4_DIAVI